MDNTTGSPAGAPTGAGGSTPSTPAPTGPSGLEQALTLLSGQDAQKVIGAVTSALKGNPQDLKNVLADIDTNSQNISTLLSQVQGREQQIQQIDAALQQLQAQIPGLDAEIAGIRSRITVKTQADIQQLFGGDLLK